MLVWKAILLMTAVMSAILFELLWISFIVFTTSRITLPPSLAVFDACAASLLALRVIRVVFHRRG
jgi:hypothetical protein